MVAATHLLRHTAVEESADGCLAPIWKRERKSKGEQGKEEKAEQGKIKGCRSGGMEKGEKGRGRLVGEMRRWLSSGSERPRMLTFSALGMGAPDSPGGASHFPVRR